MRSSKSRSRSKSNRTRSMGNIVNRVFDSSGPEGKVRGTPQQIIEKYHLLARDAQLSNDRVAEQNFLQHAEHYTRMLGEAQREMAREQEGRRDQGEGQPYSNGNGRENGGRDRRDREREDAVTESGVADVIDLAEGEGGSELVETPEQRRAEAGRRRPIFRTSMADEAQPQPVEEVQPKVAAQPAVQPAAPVEAPAQPAVKAEEAAAPAADAAEAAEKKPRRPRAPRKPRKTAEEAGAPAGASDPQTSAAE